MDENVEYLVNKDIIIVDNNTGVEQFSSKFSEGLHIFL